MNEEHKILETWISIKEAGGPIKARKTVNLLLLIGISLSVLIAILVYLRVNPILYVALSIILGWSIAERNALTVRIKMWPKLDKYLNWELISKNCEKKNA